MKSFDQGLERESSSYTSSVFPSTIGQSWDGPCSTTDSCQGSKAGAVLSSTVVMRMRKVETSKAPHPPIPHTKMRTKPEPMHKQLHKRIPLNIFILGQSPSRREGRCEQIASQ